MREEGLCWMDLFSEREARSLMERLWQQVSAMLYLQVVSWSSIHWEVRTYMGQLLLGSILID